MLWYVYTYMLVSFLEQESLLGSTCFLIILVDIGKMVYINHNQPTHIVSYNYSQILLLTALHYKYAQSPALEIDH